MSARKRYGSAILICFGLVVLAALASLVIRRSEEVMHAEVEQKSVNYVQAAVKDVDGWLDRKVAVVAAAARFVQHHPNSLEGVGDMLHALASVDSDNVSAAIWVGPRLAATGNPVTPEEELILRNLKLAVMPESGAPSFSTVFPDPSTHRPAIAVMETVRIPTHPEPVQVMFVERLDSLASLLRQLNFGESGYAFLTDARAITLVHPDRGMVFQNLTQHGDNGFAKLGQDLRRGQSGFTYYSGRGVAKIAAYTRLPETGWMFGVVLPESEAFGPARILRHNTLLLVLCLVVLFAVVMYVTGRGLNNTFRQLSQTVTSSQIVDLNGGLQEQSSEELSPEERLEQLAITLNRAVSNLEAFPDVLNRILGLKDAYTGQHSRNVTELAVAIGDAMGLQERELRELACAAVLHDIGKVAVPDAILGKPGQLTEAEYEVIKKHSAIGADVARETNIAGPIVDAIQHHHERFDGRGYPGGLAGEDIPLYARIIAVADTFDAMHSHRPYRPARPAHQVVTEMTQWAGTQFDSEVFEAFLRVVRSAPDFDAPVVDAEGEAAAGLA